MGCGHRGGKKAGSLTCGNLLYLGFKSSLRSTEPVRPLILVINARFVVKHTQKHKAVWNSLLEYIIMFLKWLLLWSYYITVLVVVIPRCVCQAIGSHYMIIRRYIYPLMVQWKAATLRRHVKRTVSTSPGLLWSELPQTWLWLGKHTSSWGDTCDLTLFGIWVNINNCSIGKWLRFTDIYSEDVIAKELTNRAQ